MAEFKVNKNRVAKNTIALYVRMAFTMVISFFAARVTLQQLGVDDYGLNNLVGSVVTFLGFLNTSIGTAIQRFYSIEIGKGKEGNLKQVFRTGLYMHIVIALITVFMLELFAVFFLGRMNIPAERMTAAHVVFQFSITQFAISIISVPYSAMLRAREFFDKMAILDVIQAVLRLGVLYLLVIVGYDKLVTLAALNFIVSVLYSFGIFVLAWRLKEVHAMPNRDRRIVKQLLAFVSMLIVSTVASLAKTQGLVMLVNLFFGLAINAAYAIAVQVSHLLNTFVLNFKSAMLPQMVSSYGAGDKSTMHKFIDLGTKITGLMMLFISLPVIFESHFLLTIWLKQPPQYAAELVALVVINVNIGQLTYFHYQGIQATGKITLNQSILTILYVLTVFAYYSAFKLGASFYSALYINYIMSAVIVLNGLLFSHKLFEYNIKSFINNVLIPLIAITFVTVLVLFGLCHYIVPSFGRAILVFVVSTLLLLGMSWTLLFNRKEKDQILTLLKKKN